MAGIPLSKQVVRTKVTAQRSSGLVGKEPEAAELACPYSRPQETSLVYWSLTYKLYQTLGKALWHPLEVKELAQGQQHIDWQGQDPGRLVPEATPSSPGGSWGGFG